jgi:hypothetical protein
MAFLNATNPQTIKLMRSAMVGVGFKVQRMATSCWGVLRVARPTNPRRRWAARPSRKR